MALADTAQLAVRLTLDDRQFTGPLNRVQGRLKAIDRGFGRTQRALGRTSGALQRTATIAATAATGGFLYAVHAAADFQDAFQGIVKTVDAPEKRLAELRQQIRDMAKEMPIAATELAAIGETAGALGIPTDFIDEFIRTVAKLGATTNLSTDAAADALGRISTILGFTGRDMETFSSALVALGNKGASTEAEIIEITKRFAASGKQAGLTTDQILAYSSAISSLGTEPEAGGSSLSRIFSNIVTETANATKKGKTFARVAGVSFKDFSKIVKDDTNKAMLLFLSHLGKLDKFDAAQALKSAGITNVRDRDAILKLAQNTEFLNEQLKLSGEAIKDTSAIDKEAAKRFDTFNSKVQIAKNTLNDVGITIGDRLLPKIQPLLDEFGNWVATHGPDIERFGDQAADAFTGLVDAARKLPWQSIIDGLKTAAVLTGGLIKAFTSLPPALQGLLLTGFVANKATGGLVGALGHDVGGLIFNKLFTGAFFQRGSPTNPMYVVPLGGGLGGGIGGKPGIFGRAAGGLGAALGGGTALGAAAIAASGAALVALLAGVQKLVIEPGLQREAGENIADTNAVIASGNATQIKAALDGVRSSVDGLDPLQRVLYELNADGVKVHTESLIGALQTAFENAQKSGRKNLQPLPAKITPKQLERFNSQRASAEANRIAQVTKQVSPLRWSPAKQVQVEDRRAEWPAMIAETREANRIAAVSGAAFNEANLPFRLDANRTAIDASKTAIIASAHSDRNAIVTAVRSIRPVVTVNVSGLQQVTTVVRTGMTVNKTSTGFNVRPGIPEI